MMDFYRVLINVLYKFHIEMLWEILSNELMVDNVIYDYVYHNQWIKFKSRMLPREEWVRHRTYYVSF